MNKKNFAAAVEILKGNVVTRDRRKDDAHRIDHTIRTVKESGRTRKIVRTDYGVSNSTHEMLVKLAARVDVVKGRFEYVF